MKKQSFFRAYVVYYKFIKLVNEFLLNILQMKENQNNNNIEKLIKDSYLKINRRFDDKYQQNIREEGIRRLSNNQRNLFHYIELETHEVCKQIQINFGKKMKQQKLKEWLLIIRGLSDELQKLFDELNIQFLYPVIDKIIYSLSTMSFFICSEREVIDQDKEKQENEQIENERKKIIYDRQQKIKNNKSKKSVAYTKYNKLGGVSLYNQNYRRKLQYSNEELLNLEGHRNNIFKEIENNDHFQKKVDRKYLEIDENKKNTIKEIEEGISKTQIHDIEFLHSFNVLQETNIGLKNVIECYKEEKLKTLRSLQLFFKKGMKILSTKNNELQLKIKQHDQIIEKNKILQLNKRKRQDVQIQTDKCKVTQQLAEQNTALHNKVKLLKVEGQIVHQSLTTKNAQILNLQKQARNFHNIEEKLRQMLTKKNTELSIYKVKAQKYEIYSVKRKQEIVIDQIKKLKKHQLQNLIKISKNMKGDYNQNSELPQFQQKSGEKKVHFKRQRTQNKVKTFMPDNSILSSKKLFAKSQKFITFRSQETQRQRKAQKLQEYRRLKKKNIEEDQEEENRFSFDQQYKRNSSKNNSFKHKVFKNDKIQEINEKQHSENKKKTKTISFQTKYREDSNKQLSITQQFSHSFQNKKKQNNFKTRNDKKNNKLSITIVKKQKTEKNKKLQHLKTEKKQVRASKSFGSPHENININTVQKRQKTFRSLHLHQKQVLKTKFRRRYYDIQKQKKIQECCNEVQEEQTERKAQASVTSKNKLNQYELRKGNIKAFQINEKIKKKGNNRMPMGINIFSNENTLDFEPIKIEQKSKRKRKLMG